jgi:predicted ATPase
VHILATGREALQVDGEQIYRLEPLACPPDDAALTAATARTFPATQLFIERAAASGARLDFDDAQAGIVVGICRKLDGVALAIELAARRVEAYGLQQTAALLDQRLTLMWLGPRTAPPRQRTLQATLDWSYGLLSNVERLVLRRLAVFVGRFTLNAALSVATSADVDQAAVFSAIDNLIAKSMVATRPVGAMMRYRLLDTTRAYVLGISSDDAEIARLAARHAAYFRLWLEQDGKEWATLSSGMERSLHFSDLNNARAALEWCFGEGGDVGSGSSLRPPRRRFFWRCRCCPSVIGGHNGQLWRSTIRPAAKWKRCNFRQARELRRCTCMVQATQRVRPCAEAWRLPRHGATSSAKLGSLGRCRCSAHVTGNSKSRWTTQSAPERLP